MDEMPLMKCGCVAQGYLTRSKGKKIDPPIPVCLIHDCREQMEKPDLRGRTARCTYYGSNKPKRRFANDECNYGCYGKNTCMCGNIPSRYSLAFFKYQPDKSQDNFYCGCHGWD